MKKNSLIISRRLAVVVMLALVFCHTAYSQKMSTATDNLIPPSPEAAALGKYAAIPVGLYTGTPQIGIPVWELREGDISLPVSFSYHATGNKVDEIAPRTGMGWTLNAGGVVTRTIIKRPDEIVKGFLEYSSSHTPQSIYTGTEQEKYNRWKDIEECYDAEPDQFSFNFAGYTGTFAFDWSHNIIVGSDRKVKVEPIGLAPDGSSFIQGWKITGEDGTVYTFEAKESTHISTGGINPCTYGNTPVTSWYLTSIVSLKGNAVYFAYQPYQMDYNMLLSETISHKFGVEPGEKNTSIGRMTARGQYLSQITTKSGNTTINFVNAANTRIDVPSVYANPSLFALGEIIVLNKRGEKNWHVKQTYDYSAGRLTLKSIQELPVDGSTVKVKPPYQFTYYSSMPAVAGSNNVVGSYQQDHWGFFNNGQGNTLIPPYTAYVSGTPVYYTGSQRNPVPEYVKAGILTQIKYPTGGTTSFEYEANEYSFVGSDRVTGYDTAQRSLTVRHEGSESTDTTIVPFTVTNVTDPAGVEFYIEMGYCSSDGGFGSAERGPQVRITEATGKTVMWWNYASDPKGGRLHLPPGIYLMKVSTRHTVCEGGGYDYGAVRLTWEESSGLQQRKSEIGGGLRVKKITDYDGMNISNNIVRKFDYKLMENGLAVSSGVIAVRPKYTFSTIMGDAIERFPYVSRISNSIIALGSTQGSPIGYRQVNVYYGENGEGGKSESYYTSFYEMNDDYTHNYEQPFPPASNYDYGRGLLQKQIEYKYENGNYKPVKQVDNTYESKQSEIFALKVGKKCEGCSGFNASFTSAEDFFALGGHVLNLGISKLKTSKETLIDSTGNFITEERYEYDPTLQFLQKEISKTSDGKEIVTEYSYPFNYLSAPFVYSLMQGRHMYSPIIEKIVKEKAADGTEKVIDASFTQYEVNAENKVLPTRELALSISVPPTSFSRSTQNGGWPDFQYYDSLAVYNRFSSLGKPEQVTARGGVVSAYIWGYNGTQLIAQIANAPVDACAFTSFEDWDYVAGNWQINESSAVFSTNAHTGRRAVSGQVSTVKVLPQGQYVLSFWAKGSISDATITINGISKNITSSWNRYEWIMTNPGSITIQTNGQLIDDLRLHPVGAQMKTYNHEPGVGITSATDENNRTVFYEYDNYNRLRNIKDNEGNILKNYQYNYKD